MIWRWFSFLGVWLLFQFLFALFVTTPLQGTLCIWFWLPRIVSVRELEPSWTDVHCFIKTRTFLIFILFIMMICSTICKKWKVTRTSLKKKQIYNKFGIEKNNIIYEKILVLCAFFTIMVFYADWCDALEKPLLVSTTHLFWDPRHPDIKLEQTKLLTFSLFRVVSHLLHESSRPLSLKAQELTEKRENCSKKLKLSPLTFSDIPIIVTMDSNSLPYSEVYNYWRFQYLLCCSDSEHL